MQTPKKKDVKTDLPVGSLVKSTVKDRAGVVSRHASGWVYVNLLDGAGNPVLGKDGAPIEVAERAKGLYRLGGGASTPAVSASALATKATRTPAVVAKTTPARVTRSPSGARSKAKSPKKKGDEEDEAKKASVLAAYKSLLARYPTRTNLVQSCLLTGREFRLFKNTRSSVLAASALKDQAYDWVGCVTMMVVSVTLITPTLLVYYGWLNSLENVPVLLQMVGDQGVFGPCFNLAILCWRGVLLAALSNEPIDPAAIVRATLAIMPAITLKGWAFWIPVRLLTITVVPPMYHVIVSSLGSFCWNLILQLAL